MKGFARQARRWPLTVFFGLAYAISWALFAPLVLSRAGLGLFPIDMPIEYVIVPTLGPTLAAVTTHWLIEGDFHVFSRPDSWQRLMFGAVVGPLLVAIAFAALPALLLVKGSPGALNWSVFGSTALVNWSTFLGGPLGEEPGWRGYALPRLLARLGPAPASVILGLLWTFWHLPTFLLPNWISLSLPSYAVTLIGITMVMTFVTQVSGSTVLAPILMHATFNTSSKWLNGLLSGAAVRENISPVWILALAWIPVALFAAGLSRARSKRRKHAEETDALQTRVSDLGRD